MDRTPEPELMEDVAQAEAYARADFDTPNEAFVDRFLATFPDFVRGSIVDLGCGPADIPLRLARRLPEVRVTGVDGSAAMLAPGRAAVEAFDGRVVLVEGTLPGAVAGRFDAVISNSLLHHLHDPDVLWAEVVRVANPGAVVLVADLSRPDSADAVDRLVEQYAANEPEVLRRDFRNSLHAAFTTEEIEAQLARHGLALEVERISDRHVAIHGRL
ncbi:MAG: class I SAM-dependent methyltransferase [Deltaproteobacteria bacterium]|jgi:SAM-dependent methyltransferase